MAKYAVRESKEAKSTKQTLQYIVNCLDNIDTKDLPKIGRWLFSASQAITMLPKDAELIVKILQQKHFNLSDDELARKISLINFIQTLFHSN